MVVALFLIGIERIERERERGEYTKKKKLSNHHRHLEKKNYSPAFNSQRRMSEAAERLNIRETKIIMAVCATNSEGRNLSKTGIGASAEVMVLTSTCVDCVERIEVGARYTY